MTSSEPGDAVPDILGAPYTAETLELAADDEGQVVATLVHRAAARRTDRAVLHVHGFADYFFQTAYADWWTERGYDFYALDLRKYGRSIRPHQTPNYVTDLAHYHPELDLAWDRVKSGHEHVVLSGHSTGGLVVPLWADARRLEGREVAADGIVLNAPWFDLQGKAWVRLGLTPVVEQVAKRQPMRVVPRTVTGLYARSLHRDHEGEWDFNLLERAVHGSDRARRGRPLHRHRPRRGADPALVVLARPPPDLRGHRRCPARRLPLPRGAPRTRLRRARPVAGGVHRVLRWGPAL
jgi:alpha-beta hydrolase superfamily lysophospholipase